MLLSSNSTEKWDRKSGMIEKMMSVKSGNVGSNPKSSLAPMHTDLNFFLSLNEMRGLLIARQLGESGAEPHRARNHPLQRIQIFNIKIS